MHNTLFPQDFVSKFSGAWCLPDFMNSFASSLCVFTLRQLHRLGASGEIWLILRCNSSIVSTSFVLATIALCSFPWSTRYRPFLTFTAPISLCFGSNIRQCTPRQSDEYPAAAALDIETSVNPRLGACSTSFRRIVVVPLPLEIVMRKSATHMACNYRLSAAVIGCLSIGL